MGQEATEFITGGYAAKIHRADTDTGKWAIMHARNHTLAAISCTIQQRNTGMMLAGADHLEGGPAPTDLVPPDVDVADLIDTAE